MKGQISFVEYLASLTLFIAAVLYIAFQLINFVPAYLVIAKDQRVRIDAYQISEILVDDPGKPINWYTLPSSQIVRLGLSSEIANKTNFLSLQKITVFNGLCKAANGYSNLQSDLGTSDNFAILLFNRTADNGTLLINCQPASPISSSLNTTVRRTVAIDSNDIGEMIVQAG